MVENAFEHRGLKQSMSEWPVPEASAYTRTFGYDAYRRVESMFPSIHDRWGRDTVTLDEMENRKFAEIDGQIFRYQTVSANQYLNFEPPTNNDRAYEVVKYDGTGSIPHATGDGNEGAFTYDDRGYLTSDRLFTYSCDAFNRLSTVEVTHSSEDAQVTYLYDAMGRRVARLYTAFDYDDWWWLKYASIQSVVISPILGNLEDGQSVHVYELHAYSGKQLIEERSFNADRVAKRNYFGPALNQVIATEHIDNTGTATAYVAITDEQGSLMGVTDDSGDLKERFSYNSTGLMKQIDVDEFYEGPKYESAYIPFAWHGMYKERLTGKLHTHYRDYDPFHGRWLSEDPMGMMDGMNLYAAYMGPNGIDPEGGAIVSGTLAAIGIYTAVQASFAAAETVVEYGMHRAMGSEGDFLGGSTFLKNFGINMATGGIGGKAKLSWKFANASLANQGVKSFGYRFGLEVAAESAYDVHFRGQSAGSSLAINTIGGIAGEGIARLIGAGFNSAKNAIKRSIDDITDGIDLSRGIGRSSSQVKHVNDIAYALYDGGSGYRRWHRMSSYETLRKEFNNSARAQYIKHFATTERAAKMFTENELRKMARRGVMPTGYVVHHLKPLYRGGDNAFNNLRVMTEAFHIKHGSKLHYYTQGSNPYGRN